MESSERLPQVGEYPESSKQYYKFMGHEMWFGPEASPVERMRLLSNPDWLSPYHKLLFESLFPDALPAKDFDTESIAATKEVELSPAEKEVRRVLMEHFGFVTPTRKMERGEKEGAHDIWSLGVAFTTESGTITKMLNNLPGFRRLSLIGQTDPRLRSVEDHSRATDDRLAITRADHSKDLAQSVAMTNITMALKAPRLYLERVQADGKRYGKMYAQLHGLAPDSVSFAIAPSAASKEAVKRAMSKYPKEVPEKSWKEGQEALFHATEYIKYQLVASYLHDIKTPGWGDIFMKAKPTRIGQRDVDYSEDHVLKNDIFAMVQNERTGLPQLIARFSMNPKLLATMIAMMAAEGDPCLPGYLMKDKRKYTKDVLDLFPHLQAIAGSASFDHDQRSGTRTNAEYVINRYLPGGFVRLRRSGNVPEPIGSFEERARLLMFALASGATREDLTNACVQMHIDPARVSMAAEEIDFGPNVTLTPVNIPYKNPETGTVELRREVMPVALRPGDVKKAILLFNMLGAEYYMNPARAATEEILQDMVTACMWGNRLEGDTSIYPDDFIYGTDSALADKLETVAPVIPWILEDCMEHGRIVTEEELARMARDPGGALDHCFVKECSMDFMVTRKYGTFVQSDEWDDFHDQHVVRPYIDVIRKRRGEPIGTVNPLSLPARLDALEKRLQSTRTFYLIDLPPEKLDQLRAKVDLGATSKLAILRALLLWTEPVEVGGETVRLNLWDEFSREGYEINAPLLARRG
ncbi:hypothetical protein A2973_05460 [Candidatus Gottesmanbacteria bacterium RIFCSPLOWO2_01_FULL_49_10]|uniref:Uncharacterized protein n=1 Tax=Candidatus Gottesmanbacteria bacterium RIFCSPLOWO2_01_FULL_49_10 TaxID=1798396 RepID=A0A1F6B1C3_9BACT|nr:MAG: hypothetical protein A2973_05460 [Candidatus Gottesmanbacteria bacterium RIFCSPLOWO2_01_FULL_49_10]